MDMPGPKHYGYAALLLIGGTNVALYIYLALLKPPHAILLFHQNINEVHTNMSSYTMETKIMLKLHTAESEEALYGINFDGELNNVVKGNPFSTLPQYRNPCWMTKLKVSRAYKLPYYDVFLRGHLERIRNEMQRLHKKRCDRGHNWRLRCMPYAILIGVSKCGTTDLFHRVTRHPEIFPAVTKETFFWSRNRMKSIYHDPSNPINFTDYVDYFDQAAEQIRAYQEQNSIGVFHPAITMEGTPHYLWDFDGWQHIPGNTGLSEPRYTLARDLYALRPSFKFLVILRNPTDRLYSMYRMMSRSYQPTAQMFHDMVIKSLDIWSDCLRWNTERGCVYNGSLIPWDMTRPGGITLRAGMYHILLKDWLSVFPRSQFHVIKFEDYQENATATLKGIFEFLGVRYLSDAELKPLTKHNHMSSPQTEPMLPETRIRLNGFYAPVNSNLGALLNDEHLSWMQ